MDALGHTVASASLPDPVEAVAVDGAGRLYVATRIEVFEVDPATGRFHLAARVPAPIVDIAAEASGALYIETVEDRIEYVGRDGSGGLFAHVAGDGRLAVSPDGWLVRLVPAAGRMPEIEEWPVRGP
jgi:hypothetical protein